MMEVEVKEKVGDGVEEEVGEVWLHYVGAKLYDIKTFIREAERHGVQRTIPLNFLKRLKWHEKIYLGQLISTQEGRGTLIFGYFTVDKISYTGSDEFKEAVRKRLRIVGEYGGGETVDRACGTYTVGGGIFVDNTVEEIYQAIREAINETGEKPKIFIAGNLYLIEPVIIQAPFTRALVRIPFDESKVKIINKVEAVKRLKALEQLIGYKQRRYLSKKEREALKMQKLI